MARQGKARQGKIGRGRPLPKYLYTNTSHFSSMKLNVIIVICLLLLPISTATKVNFEDEFCHVSIDGPTVLYYSIAKEPFQSELMTIGLTPGWEPNLLTSDKVYLRFLPKYLIHSKIDTKLSPRYVLENESYSTSVFGLNGTLSWQLIDDGYNEKLIVEACAPFREVYLYSDNELFGTDAELHHKLEVFKNLTREVTISAP